MSSLTTTASTRLDWHQIAAVLTTDGFVLAATVDEVLEQVSRFWRRIVLAWGTRVLLVQSLQVQGDGQRELDN